MLHSFKGILVFQKFLKGSLLILVYSSVGKSLPVVTREGSGQVSAEVVEKILGGPREVACLPTGCKCYLCFLL